MKPDRRDNVPGTLYLIHFDAPIGDTSRPWSHAQHYLGWAEDLEERLARHRAGNGAAIMAHLHALGIGWRVVWTAPGTRNEERRLKNASHLRRRCEVCR